MFISEQRKKYASMKKTKGPLRPREEVLFERNKGSRREGLDVSTD